MVRTRATPTVCNKSATSLAEMGTLEERGAKKVYAYCTHPIFSGPAIDRIAKGDALDEVVVTDTIPLSLEAQACQKIRQLSVAPLIAETIQRIAKGESVMSLFSDQDQLF